MAVKRIPEEAISASSITKHSFDLETIYNYGKGKVKLRRICLKQDSVSSFIHENVVNVGTSYELFNDIKSRFCIR